MGLEIMTICTTYEMLSILLNLELKRALSLLTHTLLELSKPLVAQARSHIHSQCPSCLKLS
jgi:hypothetical protein